MVGEQRERTLLILGKEGNRCLLYIFSLSQFLPMVIIKSYRISKVK